MSSQALADTPCEFSQSYDAPLAGRFCTLTRQACHNAKKAVFVHNCETRQKYLKRSKKY